MNCDLIDIENIKQKEMDRLADQFSEYIDLLEEVMIIPDEIYEEKHEEIYESIKIVKKLIKKLRKGDKSVFKDQEEWNYL